MPKISEEKKQKNRHHLINVAKQLFFEHGYQKTSVNDIVREAKVSKGGFYTYFDSKETLFFELLFGNDQEISNHSQMLIAQNGDDAIQAYIQHRLGRYLNEENRRRAKYMFEYWATSRFTPEQRRIMNERYEAFEKDIITIIELGQKKGIYRKDLHLPHFIHVLMSSLDGLIYMDTVSHRQIDEEIIAMTTRVFRHFLEDIQCSN